MTVDVAVDVDFAAVVEVFAAESSEILDRVEGAAISLEEQPEDDELIQTIFRGAHTLKGNASCLGLGEITRAAHELEDVFEILRAHKARADSRLVTLVLSMVDVFRDALPAATEGRDEIAAWAMPTLDALREWAAARTAGAGAEGSWIGSGEGLHESRYADRALRVGMDRLDEMIDLTGEFAIARGRLAMEIARAGANGGVLDAFAEAERLSLQIQELVTRLRLVPVGTIFRPFVRTVRDLAAAEGKKARLIMEGAEVEVDLSVVEHLRDPLMHMIRNAVDHGLETPEVRTAKGKPAEGRIELSARHEAGNIVIDVKDDGRGFDREAIAARGRQLGIDVEKLGDRDLLRLVLEPGFSTAGKVTEISGRGVGLDVVRRSVETLRGSIDIEDSGGGALFTLRLPLTLAIIDGFGVRVAGEAYIIPLPAVLECLDIGSLAFDGGDGSGIIDLRGEPLPVIDLGRCVGARPAMRARHVVVVHGPTGRAGLAVDGLEGLHQSVIKPLGRFFGRLADFSGSSILSDGRVALVLDVASLVERAARNGRANRRES